MPTLYSLNMTVDLSGDSTGFFNPYVTNASRCWLSTSLPVPADPGPPPWTPCNGGNNNSDTWGPALVFHRDAPETSDQVQFVVNYQNLPAEVTINSCAIYVAFGRKGHANAPNQTASPFTNTNNARCLLGDEGSTQDTGSYYIGPYIVNINTSAVPNNGNLNFEFSMACSIALSNGQTYQFGYDPEMDLTVEE